MIYLNKIIDMKSAIGTIEYVYGNKKADFPNQDVKCTKRTFCNLSEMLYLTSSSALMKLQSELNVETIWIESILFESRSDQDVVSELFVLDEGISGDVLIKDTTEF